MFEREGILSLLVKLCSSYRPDLHALNTSCHRLMFHQPLQTGLDALALAAIFNRQKAISDLDSTTLVRLRSREIGD